MLNPKRCSCCKIIKSIDHFRISNVTADGKTFPCRDCLKKKERIVRSKPEFKERVRQYHKDRRDKDPQQYRKTTRDNMLKYRHGLSTIEYNNILQLQNNSCLICKTTNPGNWKQQRFHVDHSHRTGKIRGLLCQACNTGLGHFKDSPDLLRIAATYIEQRS